MVPELEKPKITEINVRMDCNGCVQKIKKALHGINGIYDLTIDFPQQKLTIIGWADPEKIVKAIKKARKTATINSHSELPDPPPAQPTEQPPPDQPAEQPQPDQQAAQPPPDQQSTPPAEPPKDPPAPENPTPDTKTSNAANESLASQPSGPQDGEVVRVIYYNSTPDHGYRYDYSPNYSHSYGGQWNSNPNYTRFQQEPLVRQVAPQPVTHNYNTYKPSSSVTHTYNTYRPPPRYTEDNYIRSPPQYTYYRKSESSSDDYNSSNGNGNGNITSIFSDENPNSCRIA